MIQHNSSGVQYMSGSANDSSEKRNFIGHAVRADPNIDKEPTKPVERRKKPRFSFRWESLRE
jgi:hypothetical protein